jgi:hypothetical protein
VDREEGRKEGRKERDGEEAGPGQGPGLLLALALRERLRLRALGGGGGARGRRAEGPGEQPAGGAGQAQGLRRRSCQDPCFPSRAQGEQANVYPLLPVCPSQMGACAEHVDLCSLGYLCVVADMLSVAASVLLALCRPWSSRCPCTATDAPRKSRSTSPRWTV